MDSSTRSVCRVSLHRTPPPGLCVVCLCTGLVHRVCVSCVLAPDSSTGSVCRVSLHRTPPPGLCVRWNDACNVMYTDFYLLYFRLLFLLLITFAEQLPALAEWQPVRSCFITVLSCLQRSCYCCNVTGNSCSCHHETFIIDHQWHWKLSRRQHPAVTEICCARHHLLSTQTKLWQFLNRNLVQL